MAVFINKHCYSSNRDSSELGNIFEGVELGIAVASSTDTTRHVWTVYWKFRTTSCFSRPANSQDSAGFTNEMGTREMVIRNHTESSVDMSVHYRGVRGVENEPNSDL